MDTPRGCRVLPDAFPAGAVRRASHRPGVLPGLRRSVIHKDQTEHGHGCTAGSPYRRNGGIQLGATVPGNPRRIMENLRPGIAPGLRFVTTFTSIRR